MNRQFDFYEYAGFLVPGTVLCVGLLLFFPEARVLFAKDGVSFGEFGVLIVLAYAAGQLVQGVGNLIESAVSLPFGGKHGVRALSGKLLSPTQYSRLVDSIKQDPHIMQDITSCERSEYQGIVGAIYAKVAIAGKAARIDIFNGNYGLMRGLAASFLVLTCLSFFIAPIKPTTFVLIGLVGLSIQRMQRYSGHYAKELLTQYLLLDRGGGEGKAR